MQFLVEMSFAFLEATMPLPYYEIRKYSAQNLAAEREFLKRNSVSESTPPTIDIDIIKFADELVTEPVIIRVPVVDDKYGVYGWCSDGVREKIKHERGAPLFGWTVWLWPDVMLTAEFHCIWVSDQGVAQDITPKPARENEIIFVPDKNYTHDFDFDKRPGNRRFRIYREKSYTEEIEAHIRRFSEKQLEYELAKAMKSGMTLEASVRKKLPPDKLPVMIERLIELCRAFEERSDSLGMSGPITADQELIKIARERIQLTDEVKFQITQMRNQTHKEILK